MALENRVDTLCSNHKVDCFFFMYRKNGFTHYAMSTDGNAIAVGLNRLVSYDKDIKAMFQLVGERHSVLPHSPTGIRAKKIPQPNHAK